MSGSFARCWNRIAISRAAGVVIWAALWTGGAAIAEEGPKPEAPAVKAEAPAPKAVVPTPKPEAPSPQAPAPAAEVAAPAATAEPAEGPAHARFFAAHIQPILNEHCVSCHGETKKRNNLDLRTIEATLKGGKSGPAVVAGSPEQSILYTYTRPGADPHMPPKEKQLSDQEMNFLAEWVRQIPPPEAAKKITPDTPAAKENAASTLPAGLRPNTVIDLLVEKGWNDRNIQPAGPADDRVFVRRVHLDLVGRIPTPAEVDAFLGRTESDKRTRLVDDLLKSPEHAGHLAQMLNVLLMGRGAEEGRRRGGGGDPERQNQGWIGYLERAVAENRPWNEVAREMIVARPEKEEQRGSGWFLAERKENHQAMAEAVASGIFGVQIGCAQCHDHKLAGEIKQAHYWGLVSVFSRSKSAGGKFGPAMAESAVGAHLKFTNLAGQTFDAPPVFLGDIKISEPDVPKKDGKEQDLPELYLGEGKGGVRQPKYSRREAFADAYLKGNPLVARAMVNRVWALLMGRGLVHPYDKMDSVHPASHPELLDWLARDFEASGYDVRRLVRGIVLSRPYQLQAVPPSSEIGAESFAWALDKPLPAEAYARSIYVAMTGKADVPQAVMEQFKRRFPDLLPDEHNASLQQALFLTNNALMNNLVKGRDNNLTQRLTALKDDEARITEAFASLFGRGPDEPERKKLAGYLAARRDRTEAAVAQILWAMLTSAEFRINH